MTTPAAEAATNDNSARAATQALSVEQFNEPTAKQIEGTLMSIVTQASTATPTTDDQSRTTPAPRKWERIIGGTGRLIETCPPECEDSHATDRADIGIDDLCHGYYFSGPELPVFDAETGTALVPILAGRVQTDPYNANPDRRRPHLNFEPFQDEIMEGLTPDEFAQVIATVRAHCDELEKQHAKFAALYAEWTEDQG